MAAQIKILIVEDELAILETYAKILTRQGYQVEKSPNGSDAIGKLTCFSPDIVLLDISLPDMSGFDILSIIRSKKQFQHMFVIICTGMMTTRGHRNYGLESGADDYLYKPVTTDVLLARIKAMVRIKETENQLRNINRQLRNEIKERKRAQEDSVSKENHLRTAQQIANMGSFFTSLNGEILNCSEGLYRLFGYIPGEIRMDYQFLRDQFFSKDIDRFEQDIESIFKNHTPIDNEYRIVCKKGSIRDIRFIATATSDANGTAPEIQGIFQDITERKIMERQAIQNEKLASLGFLVSGMAHEINNPNNFISFNIPILKEYLNAILPIIDTHAKTHPKFEIFNMNYPDFRKDLLKLTDNIENGSLRINKIVTNLRKFVHMKTDVEYGLVDIKKLIQGCVEMTQGEIIKQVKTFEMTFPENLVPIETSPEILEIAVINLIINAAQSCDKPDSFVKLSVYQNEQNNLVIDVSDNGCGMDTKTMSRAFDPFFSTKTSKEGTGIGLSLCHNLITSLGGKIEVESELDQGSTFRLIIPLPKK